MVRSLRLFQLVFLAAITVCVQSSLAQNSAPDAPQPQVPGGVAPIPQGRSVGGSRVQRPSDSPPAQAQRNTSSTTGDSTSRQKPAPQQPSATDTAPSAPPAQPTATSGSDSTRDQLYTLT